jgi:hypothetical protein
MDAIARMKLGVDSKAKLDFFSMSQILRTGQGIEKFIAEVQITEILDIVLHFAFELFKIGSVVQ